MANDLKQLQMAKQESERKRKQVEQQFQESNIRLQESERIKVDASDKCTRLQVRWSLFSGAKCLL